jgi:hypothetical protein
MYLNYHPTNEFPINLENVFGLIGFAHKKNAKRTLENNFTENEDYTINVLPRETIRTGPDAEKIMLNVDTFKNLCMQINPVSGDQVIYNSMTEVSKKCGVHSKTLHERIKDGTIFNGSLWKYVE